LIAEKNRRRQWGTRLRINGRCTGVRLKQRGPRGLAQEGGMRIR